MTNVKDYLAKTYYASRKELQQRVPELRALASKTIAVVGLGCLGAPSALEFAKAGVGSLRLVDYDVVDPATTVRWPFGLRASGHSKAEVLQETISLNYPYTECQKHIFRIGRVRTPELDPTSDLDTIAEIFTNVDVIYDATAELGVQHFLSDWAWAKGITYIGVSGTLGGWGGKVFRIRPSLGTGCWLCYRWHCEKGTITEPPSAPVKAGTVQPVGCADPTFTGAGFDMLQIALSGIRLTVSTLCEGVDDCYPTSKWDALHIRLRADDGQLVKPIYCGYQIKIHPECANQHDKTTDQ